MPTIALLVLNVIISALAILTMLAAIVYTEAKISFFKSCHEENLKTLIPPEVKGASPINKYLEQPYYGFVWAKGIPVEDYKDL